jgi:ribonuclease P protein component
MYVLPAKEEPVRVGFSVSKKLGGAVVRNRTRRLIGEAVRKLLPVVRGDCDLVFVARAKAAGASLGQIAAAVEQALVRARIISRCDETGQRSSGLCQDAP